MTSDNPRIEDPLKIIEQIRAGFEAGRMGRVLIEPDRRQAIATAIGEAQPGDVVLLAGKGHETYLGLSGRRSCRLMTRRWRGK